MPEPENYFLFKRLQSLLLKNLPVLRFQLQPEALPLMLFLSAKGIFIKTK